MSGVMPTSIKRRRSPSPTPSKAVHQNWYEEMRAKCSKETRQLYVERCEELLQEDNDEMVLAVDVAVQAYPLLKYTHMDLYKKALAKAVTLVQSDPVYFERIYKQKVGFLIGEDRGGFRLTDTNYFLPLVANPVLRLDICATLLELGDTLPFNQMQVDREEVVYARNFLLQLGPEKIYKLWKAIGKKYQPMPEMARYMRLQAKSKE